MVASMIATPGSDSGILEVLRKTGVPSSLLNARPRLRDGSGGPQPRSELGVVTSVFAVMRGSHGQLCLP